MLTEHTKPSQSGYKLVLWWFNPLAHTMEADVTAIKEWISKWAQPTERVAKLLFADTKDDFFKKYFIERESTKWKEIEAKKKAEAEAKAQELREKQEAAKAAAEEAAKQQEETQAEAEQVEEPVAENTENNEPVEEAVEEKVEQEESAE